MIINHLPPDVKAEWAQRSKGQQQLLPPATPTSEDGKPTQYEGEDVDMSPALTGAVVGAMTGAGPVSKTPAINAAVQGMVNSSASGATNEDVGMATFGNLVQQALHYGLSSLFEGIPGAANVGTSVGMEAFSEDPNYSKAAISSAVPTTAAIASNIALPGVGMVAGPLASYFTQKSLKEGYLGDLVDSRSKERMRDAVEDEWGASVDDTAEMAKQQEAIDSVNYGAETSDKIGKHEDKTASGIDAAYGATSQGRFEAAAKDQTNAYSKAADSVYGVNSLKGYFDSKKKDLEDEFGFSLDEDKEKDKDKEKSGNNKDNGKDSGGIGEAEGSSDSRGDHGGGGWI